MVRLLSLLSLLSLMLVVMDSTCSYVMFFVGLFVVSLLLLFLILHTAVVLRTIGDPNHDVSLARRGLRNQLAIGVVHVW